MGEGRRGIPAQSQTVKIRPEAGEQTKGRCIVSRKKLPEKCFVAFDESSGEPTLIAAPTPADHAEFHKIIEVGCYQLVEVVEVDGVPQVRKKKAKEGAS